MGNELKIQSEKYLNDIRLFRYHEIGSENYLEKYALNMDVSEKLLSMVSVFEVIYRNKVHSILSRELASDYLTNRALNTFNKFETKKIKHAYTKAEKKNIQVKESKVITYLTLGFWCGLIENNKLWCKHLYKLFSVETRRANSLSSIIEKMNAILKIRNMISHHERIISKQSINIMGTSESITTLTLWLIEPEDKEFHDYIESYLKSKSNEISKLMGKSAISSSILR